MPAPSADAFAALARSSPWRWSTLRFTVSWTGSGRDAVRAWLRRPDVVRVETVGGALVQVVREPTGHTRFPPPAAALRPDGLVADRPAGLGFDAPMYQDYFWVAMLDPLELADGGEFLSRDPGTALDVGTVAEVAHGGRPAWEAVVRPTDRYEPRCGCCPLLRTRRIDELEWADRGAAGLLAQYPEAFRVRLDVGTGVCVRTEEIGGLTPGAGHDVQIEAVDEPMDDALFQERRRR